MTPTATPLRPITDLVPHRASLLLLDELLADTPEYVQAAFTPRADMLFLQDEGLPAWVGVELMAQTVASWAGLRRLERGEKVQLGFLLGTRKYECTRPFFPVGKRLVMTATHEMVSEQGLAVFICKIELDGEVIATASVNAFQPPNVEEYFKEYMS
ncbi:MAG: 3-hydroxylacyl-ACP dehydratase [Myxococcaceae bacterium]